MSLSLILLCARCSAASRASRLSPMSVRSEIALSSALRFSFEPLRHRLGEREAAAVAVLGAQPVQDLVELARARRDLRGDQLAVVGGFRRDVACRRRRDFARRDRETQRIGHHRHFAGRDALEAALGFGERHDRDCGGDHRRDGDRAERGLQAHLDAEFGLRRSFSHSSIPIPKRGPRSMSPLIAAHCRPSPILQRSARA